jgi:hypothetical protein
MSRDIMELPATDPFRRFYEGTAGARMTEDQIEARVQRDFDALDRRLMANQLTQADYDHHAREIDQWANDQYRYSKAT